MPKLRLGNGNWGGNQTSKDYELFMEGETPISEPYSLLGTHAVTGPNQNLTDVVLQRYTVKENGFIQDREAVLRPAQQLSLTMTLFFGNALETRLKRRAERVGCVTTLYLLRVCPDPRESHAWIWENAIFNEPGRVNDPVTIEDATPADWQSEFRITKERLLKEVGAFKVKSADAVPLNAIAWMTEDCSQCGTTPYSAGVAVGGAIGEDEEIVILLTTNRFASTAAPGGTVPAPIEVVGTSVWTEGDVVLVGFADLFKAEYDEVTKPTVGGTLISVDAGQNFALDTNITAAIMGVGRFNGRYIAVGGAGAGPAYFGWSTDGVAWNSVTTPSGVSADAFTAFAVDELAAKMYLVTAGAKLFVVEQLGDSYSFIEITGLSGSPTSLWNVRVMAEDHIQVVGKTASSYYVAESFDGGTTKVYPAISGSAAIYAQAGSRHHAVLANGSVIRKRDVLSKFAYQAVSLQLGATVTGNYRGACSAPDGYLTMNAFVTDTGEIVLSKDFSPYT